MVEMFDTATTTGAKWRKTRDGYLVGAARVARTGLQTYLGSEVGLSDRETVTIYRPSEEVFDRASFSTYAHKPVTLGHPSQMVDAETFRDTAVGHIGDEVVADGEFVRVPLVIMDAAAISAIESGAARELSMGYDCELDFTPGTTPDGQAYDAVQRNLRMNHLAVVPRARGGSKLKIGDGRTHMAETATVKTILVDGLPIETTDAGAIVIKKLQDALADAEAKAKGAATASEKALAAKDAEIDALKGKVLTDAALDARVKERAELITRARALDAKVITDGKSDDEIRRAVVSAKIGDSAIVGKSDAYIAARFDIMADEAASTDPVRKAIGDGLKPAGGVYDADEAYRAHLAEMQDAWKPKEMN